MPNFLVIKTSDVTGAPVAAKVFVLFKRGDVPRQVRTTPSPGVAEIAIPQDEFGATITVSADGGLWGAEQSVKFTTSTFGALGPPAQIEFDGPQQVNTRLVTISSRGREFNHEVHFVLGQLRDATKKVDDILRAISPAPAPGRIGLSLALPSQSIRDIQTPILNPSGSGGTLFNARATTVSTSGATLFVAERQTTPKLIAILHPGFATPSPGQPVTPLPYHLFFPPAIPDHFGTDYPFGIPYCEFIDRYLILLDTDSSSNFKRLSLGYQNLVNGRQNILVFPVGEGGLPQERQLGDLTSQAAALRLLQEVNYWVQRMSGASVPVQPIGPVALSCFSAGVRSLSKVVRGPKTPEFFDQLLRHVYLMDPWFDGPKGQTEAVQFGQALLAWHRGGAALRTLRVYSQFNVWQSLFSTPFQALPGASRLTGPAGSEEVDGPSATLLFTPLPFWFLVDPTLDPKQNRAMTAKLASAIVHDLHPAKFMAHAVKNSQFIP